MNESQENNFLDSRTLIAILMVGLVWFGWQSYLAKKYPQTEQKKIQQTEVITEPQKIIDNKITSTEVVNPPKEEQIISYEDTNISFVLSSHGMSLKNYILNQHKNRAHEHMKMGESKDNKGLFAIYLLDSSAPLNFTITQKDKNIFYGVSQVGNTKIIREIEINTETQALINRIYIENAGPDFHGLTVNIPEKRVEYSGGNFLIPSFEHQEFTVLHEGTETRVNNSNSKEKISQSYNNVSLVAISSQYFSSAILDKSEIIPELRITGGLPQEDMEANLSYKVTPGTKDKYEIKWIAYSGAKSMATLEKIDPAMTKVINHGFFATIAKYLLILLKWFYSIVGNWGLSIILLTLLVRTLVLPLNITTFRSTKKMQRIQPLIASLRERHKDDPQTLNREMMALWKEHKVNPLGGCLPMLLQLPIFFALYQVLGQSIELYQAPFIFWIKDLSLKDPYFILPILMAGAMYLQQKMTPTTMDPTQAKVMQFLPLVFALMMISLPAGLTLYILINTLSGVLLQQLFMRDRTHKAPVKVAKA